MSLIFFCYFISIVFMGQLRNDILLKKIAERIKTLRSAANVTQEEFYNDTGIHLGRIETADTNITVSTLEAICKYFKLSLHDFFKGM